MVAENVSEPINSPEKIKEGEDKKAPESNHNAAKI